jgi:hypothetical protein
MGKAAQQRRFHTNLVSLLSDWKSPSGCSKVGARQQFLTPATITISETGNVVYELQ